MSKPARKSVERQPDTSKPPSPDQAISTGQWTLGMSRTMTPEEWFNIEDNPRQRDTEHHANHARHLQVAAPTHQAVEMAQLPNGKLVKIDGHTRAFLWHEGRLAPPLTVTARVWLVPDMEAAKELYTLFDNQQAAESLADKVYGAKREFGMEFTSPILKKDMFGSGLTTAHATWFDTKYRADMYSLMPQWRKELFLLDACDPHKDKFIVPVLAASLILLRVDPKRAQDFIRKFAADGGKKEEGKLDAVEAFSTAFKNIKSRRQMFGTTSHRQIMKLMISMFEAYCRKQQYTIGKGIRVKSDKGFDAWIAKRRERWENQSGDFDDLDDTEEWAGGDE